MSDRSPLSFSPPTAKHERKRCCLCLEEINEPPECHRYLEGTPTSPPILSFSPQSCQCREAVSHLKCAKKAVEAHRSDPERMWRLPECFCCRKPLSKLDLLRLLPPERDLMLGVQLRPLTDDDRSHYQVDISEWVEGSASRYHAMTVFVKPNNLPLCVSNRTLLDYRPRPPSLRRSARHRLWGSIHDALYSFRKERRNLSSMVLRGEDYRSGRLYETLKLKIIKEKIERLKSEIFLVLKELADFKLRREVVVRQLRSAGQSKRI